MKFHVLHVGLSAKKACARHLTYWTEQVPFFFGSTIVDVAPIQDTDNCVVQTNSPRKYTFQCKSYKYIALGLILFVLGTYLNIWPEYSRHLWKQKPGNERKLYTQGWYQLCRRVNYSGEVYKSQRKGGVKHALTH